MDRDRYERAKRAAEERYESAGRHTGAMAVDSAARISRQKAEAERAQQERIAALEAAKEQTLEHLDASGFPGLRRIDLGRKEMTSRGQPSLEPGWYLFTRHGQVDLSQYGGVLPLGHNGSSYRHDYYLMADGTIRQGAGGWQGATELRIVPLEEIAAEPGQYDQALAALHSLDPGEPT